MLIVIFSVSRVGGRDEKRWVIKDRGVLLALVVAYQED